MIKCWTLLDGEWRLLRNKTGASRLAFTLLWEFFELEARFSGHGGEIPKTAVAYVAEQLDVDAEVLAGYDWSSRQTKRHRVKICEELGFRKCSVGKQGPGKLGLDTLLTEVSKLERVRAIDWATWLTAADRRGLLPRSGPISTFADASNST
ncbi:MULTISPECIES: DUF4158 domain-containing protein [unclassified Pseudofrankia]|uniref:DUF4158 domain-containing protein n=1 Tax=unclassified Pseudofrankia TaxID=2994372 RepID=UPI0008D96A2A|nr:MULTISPECIES: DUF4158 domain-containing protein [unclassified Pseudofrankia]MDT3439817.1 DUF4158 domain-containing protein [Pseudofrankia sp. BMG5.37]OHV44855.1 hypothetical protein BCD48_24440 [Pseudofrankia sp. BMG5.36]